MQLIASTFFAQFLPAILIQQVKIMSDLYNHPFYHQGRA